METLVSTGRIATLPVWTSDRRGRNEKMVQDRWHMMGVGVPDVADRRWPTFFTPFQLWPTTNNAGTAFYVNQDNNQIVFDIDVESTTVDVFNVDAVTTTGIGADLNFDSLTTGTLVDGSLNALTSGKGVKVATTSTALTTGELLDLDATISGTILTNRTGALTDIAISRTEARTSGTTADDFDVVSLHRTIVSNHAGATVTSAGSVLKIENVVTATAGSLTDTTKGIEMVMDADGTGDGLYVDLNSVTGKAINADVETTTGTGGGFNIVGDVVTTGSLGLITSASTAIAAGELLNVTLTSSGASITAKTGNVVAVAASRTDTRTSGTTADDYDLLSLTRTSIMNGAGGTLTATGSVLRLQNVATQTAGTLTDSAKGLEIVMDVDGTGAGIDIDSNNVTATAINIVSDMTTATGGVLAGAANAVTTGSALSLTSTSAVIAAGTLANIALTSSAAPLIAKTGSLVAVSSSRTEARTSGTTADDFDLLSLSRTSITNDAGATLTSTGSVLKLANVVTATLGTLTDTTIGLEVSMDADGTGNGIFVDSDAATAKGINVDTEGTTAAGAGVNIAADVLTTGSALAVTSASGVLAAGVLASIALTSAAAGLTNKTGDLVSIRSQRTESRTSGTTADNYDALSVIRTSISNDAGATLTAAGSLLYLQNIATQTTGTLTDTVIGLEIVMDVDGTGAGISVDSNNIAASAITVASDMTTATGGVLAGTANAITTGSALSLTSTSAAIAAGALANISLTSNGTALVNKTGNVVAIASSRTENRASLTTTDDYDALSVIRTSVNVTGGGTLAATGAVLHVENVATQTAGTLTDTTMGIELVMGAVGDGTGLFIDYNHATGLAVNVDPETTTGTSVQISADVLTTGTALYAVSNSADTGVGQVAHFKNDNATATSHTPLLCTQDALSASITTGLSAAFVNTQGGAVGSVVKIQHHPGNSAAADADVTGRIIFTADDEEGAATETNVGQIDVSWIDATAATYESRMTFYTTAAAAQNQSVYITGAGEVYVDLSAGAGTAGVFDDVDDKAILSMWNPDPVERDRFLGRLEDLNITHRKDTGSGWMMSLQKSCFLTWGAINQIGRWIEGLENRIAELTSQVTTLQQALPA